MSCSGACRKPTGSRYDTARSATRAARYDHLIDDIDRQIGILQQAVSDFAFGSDEEALDHD
jgi:hypothetical protein